MTLNKLQDYIITDLDLCKKILDERPNFKSDTDWKKWGTQTIRESVVGYISKNRAAKHFDWLYFYLKDRTELVDRIISERNKPQ